MVNKKATGKRAKTRYKLNRHGAKSPTVNKILKEFAVGQTVQVNIDSGYHSGLPHHRFQGLTGTVTGKQGRAFTVDIMMGKKSKELAVTSAHLKALK